MIVLLTALPEWKGSGKYRRITPLPRSGFVQQSQSWRRLPYCGFATISQPRVLLALTVKKESAMYKKFENPLPPKFGRMFVGNDAKLNQGIAQPNDTVTIRAGDSTDFYVIVEESSPDLVCGELVGIGPNPLWEYEGWSHGDKIKVSESAVTAIIRAD
jgi:hypothetical protein